MDRFKPLFKFLVVMFILYAIFSSPNQSAQVVRDIGHVIRNGAENLQHFFNAILGKE